MSALHIIYASTSGNTEFVVDHVIGDLEKNAKNMSVERQRVELCAPEDLLRGDVLLLASSTWNTGTVEGQLNPHMYVLLKQKVKNLDFAGKKVAIIGLGDDRYRYTCKAADHLEEFVKSHGGEVISTLRIINEPYEQGEKISAWTKDLLSKIS